MSFSSWVPFPVKKTKTKNEYTRDKGLVLLIKTPGIHRHIFYIYIHKYIYIYMAHLGDPVCIYIYWYVYMYTYRYILHPYGPLFKLSTCIVCLPLNLCLPLTFIWLKHCPPHSTDIKKTTNYTKCEAHVNKAHVASAQTCHIWHLLYIYTHLKQSLQQNSEKRLVFISHVLTWACPKVL